MAEQKKMDVADLYTMAAKVWTENLSAWNKMVSQVPEAFKTAGMENWYQPFWGSREDWSRAFKNFTDQMQKFPRLFDSAKCLEETMTKCADAGFEAYGLWLKSLNQVTGQWCELVSQWGNPENIATPRT